MMTKKHLRQLNAILSDLLTVKKFLFRSDIEVCTDKMPNALSFFDQTGRGLTPLMQAYGSDLVYLWNAIDKLEAMILDAATRGR